MNPGKRERAMRKMGGGWSDIYKKEESDEGMAAKRRRGEGKKRVSKEKKDWDSMRNETHRKNFRGRIEDEIKMKEGVDNTENGPPREKGVTKVEIRREEDEMNGDI